MNWYALRTFSGQEEKKLRLLQCLFQDSEFIFPRRKLSWRKQGQVFDVIKPLFRGYLFVIATAKQTRELDAWLHGKGLDIWLIKTTQKIMPISSGEVCIMEKLMCDGAIIERSDVAKIGDKVYIVRGPLVGLEGIIEKFSKRDRRVTVRVAVAGR